MQTYGLLGNNIAYSLSPLMHNAAFKALRLDAKYALFDIPEDELDGFFSRIRRGEISGCNVTIPYKEKAIQHVDEYSQATNVIGALNTIVRKDSKLRGHNTDYLGFMMALKGKRQGDLGFDPEDRNIFIFGAGGAAKAVIYVLMILKARKIVIADIDTQKAEQLANSIGEKQESDTTIVVASDSGQYNDFIANADLLINATPCGMKKDDPELFDYRYIEKRHYVFDLIYSVRTHLLERARFQAARAIDGANMLLYQAARSLEHWTGKDAPLSVMRKAIEEKVGQ